jgi:hypothetical protein
VIRRYRLSPDGVWLDKATGKPMETGPDFVPTPQITRDIAPYMSMASKQMIDGRAAQREDLKRTGCRVVDPSEYKPTYHSKERAEKHGREWEPRPAPEFTR